MRESLRYIFLPIAVIILLVLLGGAYVLKYGVPKIEPFLDSEDKGIIFIKEVPVRVKVASTTEARTRGLSNISSIERDQGLLFVFDEADHHGIWMKDMQFPIDIIWIDDSLTVIGIEGNVQPESYPRVYEPEKKARFVLETNAIFAASFSIAVGDKVRMPNAILPEDLKQ